MNLGLIKTFDFSGRAIEIPDLFEDEPHVFFLDSALPNKTTGRFSFIGFDPFEIFQGRGKDCWRLLEKKFSEYSEYFKEVSNQLSTPFGAGIVGYLSYDSGFYLENISGHSKNDLALPDCFFGFYDCVITIDHLLKKLIVVSCGLPEKNSRRRQKRAQDRLKKILQRLSSSQGRKTRSEFTDFSKNNVVVSRKGLGNPAKIHKDLKSNFTKQEYLRAVQRILEYIKCGDVYQVNLSQRFEYNLTKTRYSPFEIYQRLRNVSSFNFGGYLDCGDFQIISSSPERFIKLENNLVSTSPMKGTRARGENFREDQNKCHELLKSRKDRAELLMITDLERNDLGRVCEYGSVRVKNMRSLEKYRTVFQTTSTINGILRKDKDAFDLLQACFPGGSVTGCPKIRAMEIIEALEPNHRGVYTGALGYLSFSGRQMDFNILIRTLVAMHDKIYFHAGGGIVADSIPEEEYEETLVKARAMRVCLETYEG